MKNTLQNIREDFANKNYRDAFFGSIAFAGVGALIGAGIASGIGFMGAAAAVTFGAVFSGAAMGAVVASGAAFVLTAIFAPWILIGSAFMGNNRDGELGGTLQGAGVAGLVSVAALALTSDPQSIRDNFPTPEERVATIANKAFECKSGGEDVQIARNSQGEPTSVTVNCRR